MQANTERRAAMRAQTRRAGPAIQQEMTRILAGSALTQAIGCDVRAAVYPVVSQTPRARSPQRVRRAHAKQRGVAAVEFALVFPVVFLLVYGLITWALILLAQQTLTLAVGEGARAALRYSTSPVTAACSAVNSATTWLGTTACATTTPTATACPYLSSQSCLTVTASYDYSSKPLVPTLPFLNLVLPSKLTASTIVQLEPDAIIK